MSQPTDWPALFDELADGYDQSGVPFYGPIAEGLVERLAPAPGERALDIGCGRGAATFALAEGVGPSGRVDAIDLAPRMVRLTGERARARGLAQVEAAIGDASDPRPPGGEYDVVASSLVLFFLADPQAALRRWLSLLRPQGRLGVASFQPPTGTWRAIVEIFDEHGRETTASPPDPDPFDTDAGVEQLFTAAGARAVRTDTVTHAVPFEDVAQWERWSHTSAMRGLWVRTPQERHAAIRSRVGELLDSTRTDGGPARIEVPVRYTLGVR